MEFWIVGLPLAMFLFLGLAGRFIPKSLSGYLSTIAMTAVTLMCYLTAFNYFSAPLVDGLRPSWIIAEFDWLRFTESLVVRMGILIDPISSMMLVVISTISLMVHIYSLAYMKGELGFQRYYAFLSLFTFSMLGLVLATNLFQTYIFWELVGVSSFLLIGFYYRKPEAVSAAKKAFIVTRFADLGFLIGILILSFYSGTFDFSALCATDSGLFGSAQAASFLGLSSLTWAMALIFVGAAGKSAMFPLQIWLPDAMEGPTPVSALIHAATMVVAGVYLVARLFPIYAIETPMVLEGIAIVGLLTALYAAIVACTQNDIKRVLAFSTISQIGFMMVGLGVSGMGGEAGLGYIASMFHLTTHAMFKALLFLGAGAVIHAVHSNLSSDMGGLRKRLPITHICFLIACLAISGIPPFSGFFSKDEIIAAALMHSPWMYWVLMLIAGLTAFYMFRLYYLIFWSKESPHSTKAHEAPLAMYLPLCFLALLTCGLGFLPFGEWVSSDRIPIGHHFELNYIVLSLSVIGIVVARWMYRSGQNKAPELLAKRFPIAYRAAQNRFYIDQVYLFITKGILFRYVSAPIAWFDRHVIDAAIDGIADLTQKSSRILKPLQSGHMQDYAVALLLGAIGVAVFSIWM